MPIAIRAATAAGILGSGLAGLCGLGAVLSAHAQSQASDATSISEAYRELRDSLSKVAGFDPSMRIKITESGFTTIHPSSTRKYLFRDTPSPEVKAYGFFHNNSGKVYVFAKGIGNIAEHNCCNWDWPAAQKHEADRFVIAFKTLAAGMPPESPAEVERFQAIVRQYREAATKPEFPEDARRFRVRAESAVSDKRFDDAADRYEEALKLVPWWPEGRFNRAVVLGDLERYTEAIREMKKYLALVPDSPNARAAQDQIYSWEDKSTAPSSQAAPSSATSPSSKGAEPCRTAFGCAQQQLQR